MILPRTGWLPALLLASSLLSNARAASNNVVPSWGDYVVVFGPGTDPAMDSPQAVRNMIDHWKGRGYTGIYLRTDLAQLDPRMVRRNPVVQPNSRLALLWKRIDDVSRSFDAHRVAQQFSERRGFEYWAWHPHIYSEGAPEEIGTPGPGRMIPWSYVNAYTYEHPEVITVDRQGNRLWMVPEYAYPGVRAAKVAEFVHMAKTAGIRRFVACMRSEVSQLVDPPRKADQYGFNAPVVREMKRRHGIDILNDPRFDVDRPDFDPRDPTVNHWHDLRGEYVTQLYRDLRQALRKVDPEIRLAVTLSGERVGPPLGNWRLDWRTWVDEGLIDEIIAPATFEATLDHDADKKGYLTNVRAGTGTVSYTTLRPYIDASRHPEIKVIATGAYPYFFSPPPTGADGWRSDVWYDAYHLAWYQRWQQWKTDLAEFGHIRFLDQDFDSVDLPTGSRLEAWGCAAYLPERRACPGCWYQLGQGDDERPFVQSAVRLGSSGQAVRLTKSASGNDTLCGWHNSSPDRSTPTANVDNAVTNGRCTFEFWLYRTNQASAISAYLLGGERDVGLHVAPKSGTVSYRDRDRWTETDCSLPVGQWQRLEIQVDLDRGCYSACAGNNDAIALCRDVKYTMPVTRYVVQHGVNKPIPVPAWKQFDSVQFVPEGEAGSVLYLDEVSVRWMPTLYYEPIGKDVFFECDFEAYPVCDRLDHAGTALADPSRVSADRPENCYVASGTSFGRGVKSLHTEGGVKITAVNPQPMVLAERATITVDCDVFIRSSRPFPYMIPDPLARSEHRTVLSVLSESSGEVVASVRAGDGTWHYWDEDKYKQSRVQIAYDVWNHLQMAINTETGSYQVVVQPVGELPKPLGRARCGRGAEVNQSFGFVISPSGPQISCYDNLLIARGPP